MWNFQWFFQLSKMINFIYFRRKKTFLYLPLLRFISHKGSFVTVDLKLECCCQCLDSIIWFHIFHRYAFACFIYKPREMMMLRLFISACLERGRNLQKCILRVISDFYFYLRLMMQSRERGKAENLEEIYEKGSWKSYLYLQAAPVSATTTCAYVSQFQADPMLFRALQMRIFTSA